MTFQYFIATLALLVAAHAASAQTEHHHTPAPAQAEERTTTATTPLTDGEVRKLDISQGKITLRHGPIAHLDMLGMTMVFKVSDVSLLSGLQVGQQVRFAANRVDGVLIVTAIHSHSTE